MSNTVHMLWVKGKPPKLIRFCLKSALATNCHVCLYSYDDYSNESWLPAEIERVNARSILAENSIFTYPNGSLAAFANVFRYCVLEQRGGWWLDADIYCLRPLDPAIEYFFSEEPGHPSLVHNGIIKTPAHAEIMATAATTAAKADHAKLHWGDTGSRLMTGLLNTTYKPLRTYVQKAAYFCPIHWKDISRYVIQPWPITGPIKPFGIHLFHEMWRRHKLDNEADYPVFKFLKEQHDY